MALAASLVGIISFTQSGSAVSEQGVGYEFFYIIAAVVGGCFLTGGYGSVIGASLGALIFGIVQIGIGYTSIDNNWYRVFLGGMLLVAVLFNNFVRRRVALKVIKHSTSGSLVARFESERPINHGAS